MKELIPLTKMRGGQAGIVRAIAGGGSAARRLEALGIKIGKHIVKINSMLFHGPVTVQVGQTQISLGHGLAEKVMVEAQE